MKRKFTASLISLKEKSCPEKIDFSLSSNSSDISPFVLRAMGQRAGGPIDFVKELSAGSFEQVKVFSTAELLKNLGTRRTRQQLLL